MSKEADGTQQNSIDRGKTNIRIVRVKQNFNFFNS